MVKIKIKWLGLKKNSIIQTMNLKHVPNNNFESNNYLNIKWNMEIFTYNYLLIR